jgi:hypothetical protein
MMKTSEYFMPDLDRYQFDFVECSIEKGFAQVDTSQDFSHFGIWCNPETLRIIQFVEGDIYDTQADTAAEFVQEIRDLKKWHDDNGHTFHGIDPGLNPARKQRFVDLGLGDLLH